MSFKESMEEFFADFKSMTFSSQIPGNSKSNKQNDDNDVKMKIIETWHNFKFDISEGTNLRKDSPLWILGKCYHTLQTEESLAMPTPAMGSGTPRKQRPIHIQEFLLDFSSKPWFTYRKGFPPFEDTSLTSDTSWGCMLRTGQMMIGQCLLTHCLGRDWRWLSMQPEDLLAKKLHRDVIQLFLDEPNPRCPFGIHRLTDIGQNYQCKPGNWYGPGTVAYIMQDAMECGKGVNAFLNELVIYVAQDCTVYTDDVKEMCRWGKFSESFTEDQKRSVIILIPVRLGESTLNPMYIPHLQGLLTLDTCVGVVGGKPKHSLYFIGFQDDFLIYLDPHYCQQADTLASFSNNRLQTYHCMSPRKTHVSKLDPSCCFGFYCKDEKVFQSFCEEANKVLSPPQVKTNYPLCVIHDGCLKDQKLKLDKFNTETPRTSTQKDFEFVCDTQVSNFSDAVPENMEELENAKINQPVIKTECESSCSSSDQALDTDSSKTDKFSISLQKPKDFLVKLYRQRSRSPKQKRKDISLEEEFEFL